VASVETLSDLRSIIRTALGAKTNIEGVSMRKTIAVNGLAFDSGIVFLDATLLPAKLSWEAQGDTIVIRPGKVTADGMPPLLTAVPSPTPTPVIATPGQSPTLSSAPTLEATAAAVPQPTSVPIAVQTPAAAPTLTPEVVAMVTPAPTVAPTPEPAAIEQTTPRPTPSGTSPKDTYLQNIIGIGYFSSEETANACVRSLQLDGFLYLEKKPQPIPNSSPTVWVVGLHPTTAQREAMVAALLSAGYPVMD